MVNGGLYLEHANVYTTKWSVVQYAYEGTMLTFLYHLTISYIEIILAWYKLVGTYPQSQC